MGSTSITKEQATEALIEERRAEMQAEADQQAAEVLAEQERHNSLVEAQDKAAAILEKRAEMLPRFVEALAQVGDLATEFRGLRDEYTHLSSQCQKLGGTTEVVWPRQFGVDPKERQLLRKALEILSSVGGYC